MLRNLAGNNNKEEMPKRVKEEEESESEEEEVISGRKRGGRNNPITNEESLDVEEIEIQDLIISWDEHEKIKNRFKIEINC